MKPKLKSPRDFILSNAQDLAGTNPKENAVMFTKLFRKIVVAASLLGVAVAVACCLFVLPSVQAASPLGAEIIQGPTCFTTNLACTLTSTSSNTLTVTSNITWNVTDSERVRLTAYGDAGLDAYVGYGPFGVSNTVYLASTNGWPLTAGASITWQRPALYKGPLTFNVSHTFTTNGSTNVSFKVRSESGGY